MNKPETPTAAPVAPPETVTRWLVLLRASDGRAELAALWPSLPDAVKAGFIATAKAIGGKA
jgi:hypothetical protein